MSDERAGRGELVGPDSPLWRRALERLPHDVYHLPAWAEVEAERLGHRPAAFVYESGGRLFLLPLLMQSIPGGDRVDCASPYGYPGPLCGPDAGERFVADACRALISTLRDSGAVALFARLHPLLSPAPELLTAGRPVRHGHTVAVNLRRPEAEIWSQTRSGHRNEINRARRQGLELHFDRELSRLDDFVRLYHRTMERVGADASYCFPAAHFRSLANRLQGRLHLALVLADERLACAGLFLQTDGIVQYHLSGTDDEFVRRHPTKLMLDGVRRWAREGGHDWLHLGGGLGGRDDQLFRFKSGFSKHLFPFHTWRLILDRAAYEALVRELSPTSDPRDEAGFFPAYRKAG